MLKISAGKLIHNLHFYTQEYKEGFAGSEGEHQLKLVRSVKAQIKDISYSNKEMSSKNSDNVALKAFTYYFKDFDISMLIKIDNDAMIYKIDNIENVDFHNRILVFSLVKSEELTNGL